MTEQEDRFVYHVSCIRALNNAWWLLNEIKRCRNRTPLVQAAFRFALIEYSKPYKLSRGSALGSKGKPLEYKLDERRVPPEYRQLHQEILDARDQIHAHSDLTVRDARIYVANTSSGKMVQISENIIYGTEDLSRIADIIALIEGTLPSLYEEEQKLEAALPES